jgi:hypothetical protein
VQLGDLVAEDRRDLVGLADGAIGVEQPFAEFVEGGPAPEDEVVAELDLGEEQPMLAAGVFSLAGGKERRETGQPLLAASDEVARLELVGKLLQALGPGAFPECVGVLLKIDVLLAHAVGQPMMLVEADPRRERQVRTHADENPPPALIIDIEVVLHDPALGELQMPAVGRLVADRDHDAGGFARLQHDDDLIRLGALEVRLDELVAAARRRLQDRNVPLLRPWLQPGLEAIGDAPQSIAAHRV